MPGTSSSALSNPQLLLAAAAVGALAAGGLLLWAHSGAAVFYEAVLAGIVACF
jgi:hypothetical protein